VEANGVPLFRGHWGKHGRKIGVKIDERLPASAGAFMTAQAEERKDRVDGE